MELLFLELIELLKGVFFSCDGVKLTPSSGVIFWSYFNSKMELNVTPYRSYILAGVEGGGVISTLQEEL